MIQFEPGRRVVEEIGAGGQRLRLVSAESSIRAGLNATGFEMKYQRPLYVETIDGNEVWEIVDYTMLVRLAAFVVAVLMTVRRIFR